MVCSDGSGVVSVCTTIRTAVPSPPRFITILFFLCAFSTSCTDEQPVGPRAREGAPVQTALLAQVNNLVDPGFEIGDTLWRQITHAGRSVTNIVAHSGSQSLRITAIQAYERDVYNMSTSQPGRPTMPKSGSRRTLFMEPGPHCDCYGSTHPVW